MQEEYQLGEREFRARLQARAERIKAAVQTELRMNQQEALERLAALGEELPDGRIAILSEDLVDVMRTLAELTMQASIEAATRAGFSE